jgi:GAF domain-containing protein
MKGTLICRALDRERAAGAGLDELLASAVEKLHASNGRFHWTGIYELFPDGMLRLGPFVGAPTDHVFIAVGQGVCGTAVAEQRNINVPDVRLAPNYLACSAATRSELVVLIRNEKRIHAQVDIDSHDHDAFDRQTVREVEEVAEWLAKAWQALAPDRAGAAISSIVSSTAR